MGLNYRAAFNILGVILTILSVIFMLPVIVSIIYHEYTNALIFTGTAAAVFIAGLPLRRMTKSQLGDLGIREGFFVVSSTWIVISFVGALPFVISGEISGFADALFESCSGFSTTGATILTDIESMSRGMLFWRSFTHWIGGMGVLILAIAIIPMLYKGKQNLALESTGPTIEKTASTMMSSAKSLYLIYIGFTVIQTVLLMAGGMNLYDSLVHTFGSVGTGGFSTYNDSIAHFDSLYIEIVTMIFMFMCGVSFNLYYIALTKGLINIFRNPEFRLYSAFIAVAILIITLDLVFKGGYSAGESLRDSSFQVISIITTTGYATCDYNTWPSLSRIIIFMLFFCGGCASSTAGGIKVYRVQVIFRMVKRSIGIRLHPNAVINVSISNKRLQNEVVINVTSFVFLYLSVMAIGTLLISVDNFDFTTNLTAAASCLGNIGPGFNLVGPVCNYSIFSPFSKLVMSFLMIGGRLELYTFLAFFTPHYWNPDRY